jgi:hypothetical protein
MAPLTAPLLSGPVSWAHQSISPVRPIAYPAEVACILVYCVAVLVAGHFFGRLVPVVFVDECADLFGGALYAGDFDGWLTWARWWDAGWITVLRC